MTAVFAADEIEADSPLPDGMLMEHALSSRNGRCRAADGG